MAIATPIDRKPRGWPLAVAIFLATLAVFWPATGFEFLGVDDGTYVTENEQVLRGLSGEGIAWAFGNFHGSTWVPITYVSLMLDRSLFGPGPFGFHLSNALLHALNASLLFLLSWRLSGRRWASLILALLFALHPLRVESVAWIAERKDVLSAAFWLASTLAWVEWVRGRRRAWYVAAFVLMAVGLGAKGMLVTLPLTLLLLDYWPLCRTEPWRALIVEKLPLFGLSVAGAVVTFASQAGGTAVTTLEFLGPWDRMANAVVSAATYLGRMVWPSGLSYFYPHPATVPPHEGWPASTLLISALALIALTVVGALLARRGQRWALAGWGWYLVTLLPVSGLVQIGLHANANRFTYVPMIGVLAAMVAGAALLVGRRPSWSRPVFAVGAGLVLASAAATWRELPHWRNSESLFRRAIAVTESNGVAMDALGGHLAREGRWAEARSVLEEAVRVQPRHAGGHATLGIVLGVLGDDDAAVERLEHALESMPEHARARVALANVHARRGRLADARSEYRAALEIDGRLWEAHFGLGQIARARGNTGPAREHFQRALEHAPDEASRSRVRPFLN